MSIGLDGWSLTLADQLVASVPTNQIAYEVHDALARAPGWAEVKALHRSPRQAGTFWSDIDLPQVPSLKEVHRYARERLAHTPSLEDILRARGRLLERVCPRLPEATSSPYGLPAT